MVIAWTRVHAIDALLFSAMASSVHSAATLPEKEKSRGNIVPHGENQGKGEYQMWGGVMHLRDPIL